MATKKVYKKGNYLIVEDNNNNMFYEELLVNVRVSKTNNDSEIYYLYYITKNETLELDFALLLKEDNTAYATMLEWETFIFGVTGNANCVVTGGGGGGSTNLSYTASTTNGIVNSDTGTDATIPLVSTNAGLMSPSDKTKLDTIQSGAEVNVQSDWNETNTSSDAYILNKPTYFQTNQLKHSVKYGVALTIGQAVYVSSADGTNMIVSKADYSTESTSSKTLGLVTSSGALNYQGEVVTEGLLAGLDTSSATIGNPVWLGANGNLLYGISNKPVAPNHMVFIGIVTRVNANNGEIFVKVQNGFELEELHNVLIQSLADKHLIYYDNATSLWKNASLTSILGYTPANKAGDTFTGNIFASNLSGTNTGDETTATLKTKLGAASASQDGYLTQADWSTFNGKQNAIGYTPANKAGETFTGSISATNLSGTNTGDETTATIKTKLGTATTSTDGYLTSTDWNTFNNKQNALGFTPENVANKAITMTGNTTSNTIYLTAKAIYDWAINLFVSTTRTISTNSPLSGGSDLSANITLSISQSNTSTDGYLSSTDWNTFNNKQSALSGGTLNRIVKWSSANSLGNSIISDDGNTIAIGSTPNTTYQFLITSNKSYGLYARGLNYGLYGNILLNGVGVQGKTSGGIGVLGVSDATSTYNNTGVEGQALNSSPENIGGKFTATGGTANYGIQMIDGTQAVGKFIKSITSDGKANWATLSIADTGLTLTTTGTSGASTLVGNTLNIPQYSSGGGSSSLVPYLGAYEVFRGTSFSNNSTTVTTDGGVTMSTSASVAAQLVATTAFNLKNIRLRYYASVVSTGRYTGTRGSALLWYIGGGFRFVCSFSVSDSAYNSGSRQFFGMAGSTADLTYTDTILVASLQNIIGIGSDALDSNLQVFTNDTTGTATKIDLGANFPANRTAGSAMTTIYQVQIYNPSGSSSVYYKVVNLETGNSTEGTLTSDLPASTQGLNFFASRTMGTPVTNTGEFYLYNRFGVYSVA